MIEREKPMNFDNFKNSEPAQVIFLKLGLSPLLEDASSWQSLRDAVVEFNDSDKRKFIKAARECDGVTRSGERVLLQAICYVTDFIRLADELAAGKVWHDIDNAGREWQRAVAACIAQIDD